MAEVYVVMVKRGSGEVVAVFSDIADASAYVGATPGCNMQIVCLTVDRSIGMDVSDPLTPPPTVLDISGVISEQYVT